MNLMYNVFTICIEGHIFFQNKGKYRPGHNFAYLTKLLVCVGKIPTFRKTLGFAEIKTLNKRG